MWCHSTLHQSISVTDHKLRHIAFHWGGWLSWFVVYYGHCILSRICRVPVCIRNYLCKCNYLEYLLSAFVYCISHNLCLQPFCSVCSVPQPLQSAIMLCMCSAKGRTVSQVVKALDSQPRDRGFESRRTLSLLHLESWARLVPKMCSGSLNREMRT